MLNIYGPASANPLLFECNAPGKIALDISATVQKHVAMISPSVRALLWAATICSPLASATPRRPVTNFNSTKPPAFFLAGDSMTAVQTDSGGGYGLGFLSFLKSPAWGVDYGQNGATTVSYVQGGVQGNWTAVMNALDDAKGEYEVFVPIMVGSDRYSQEVREMAARSRRGCTSADMRMYSLAPMTKKLLRMRHYCSTRRTCKISP